VSGPSPPGRRTALGLVAAFLASSARGAVGLTIQEGETVTLPAGSSGRLQWAAWAERGRLGRIVVLALRVPDRAGGRQVWSTFRQDAYAPALRAVPDWRSRGRPLVALTLNYGAAAQEALLFVADGAGSVRQVAARLASAVEWRTDARGGTVLVAYGRDGSAVVPECLGWDGGGLVPVACPG